MGATYVVADDSMFARMLVKEAVSQIDDAAKFIEGASGADTLKASETPENAIDWYLLDINMGEPNGVLTAKALIEAGTAKEKIALVTGNKSEDLKAQADQLGVRYINKAISPIDVEGFVSRLRAFFDGIEE